MPNNEEILEYVMNTPNNTNPAVLRDMLSNSNDGLPSVTSDDNGDVLTVVGGAWAAAAPSGGGLKVNIIDDPDHENCYIFDKTAGEVFSALESGVVPMLVNAVGGKNLLFSFEAYGYSDFTGYAFETGFENFYAEGENFYPSSYTDK